MQESSGKGILWGIGLLGVGAVIGTGVGLYFLFRKPKEKFDLPADPGQSPATEEKKDSPKPNVDYTGFSVHPNPAFREKNGLILGQAVTVKKGADIWRAGVDLRYDINNTVRTDNRKALGTIFSLDPTTAVIKAKPGFNSRFYVVKYSDIEEVHKNDII
jgi:hypothetical protein